MLIVLVCGFMPSDAPYHYSCCIVLVLPFSLYCSCNYYVWLFDLSCHNYKGYDMNMLMMTTKGKLQRFTQSKTKWKRTILIVMMMMTMKASIWKKDDAPCMVLAVVVCLSTCNHNKMGIRVQCRAKRRRKNKLVEVGVKSGLTKLTSKKTSWSTWQARTNKMVKPSEHHWIKRMVACMFIVSR